MVGLRRVTNLTVTLNGVAHPRFNDVTILLQGPNGQAIRLAGKCSGPAGNVNLTFDDTAGSSLPAFPAPVTTGTYLPSTCSAFSPPGAPSPPYLTTLSSLIASNSNGVWRLWVYDNTVGLTGTIASWCLNFTDCPATASSGSSLRSTTSSVSSLTPSSSSNLTSSVLSSTTSSVITSSNSSSGITSNVSSALSAVISSTQSTASSSLRSTQSSSTKSTNSSSVKASSSSVKASSSSVKASSTTSSSTSGSTGVSTNCCPSSGVPTSLTYSITLSGPPSCIAGGTSFTGTMTYQGFTMAGGYAWTDLSSPVNVTLTCSETGLSGFWKLGMNDPCGGGTGITGTNQMGGTITVVCSPFQITGQIGGPSVCGSPICVYDVSVTQ